MADLSLHVGGDSHEAQDAMHGVAEASHEAHDATAELRERASELREEFTAGALAAAGFEKAVEAIKDAVGESIEEYAKAEAAQRQLQFAAGDMTKEFEEQAEVIGKNLAVKAEDIEHMQTMLLRYGAAPSVIGDAIVAIKNFSVATGQDANSAMMMLIRGVENGHGSLGRMGVQFQATGDFATDLGHAIEALNAKFGGAAEAEAGGLSGRMRAAQNAVDELKKSMGGFFALLEEKSHLLEATASYFNTGGGVVGSIGAALTAWNGGPKKEAVPGVEGENPLTKGTSMNVDVGDVQLAPTEKAIKDAQRRQEEYLKAYDEWQDKQWVAARKAEEQDEKADEERLKRKREVADEELKLKDEAAKAWLEQQKKLDDMEFEELKKQTRQMEDELKKREKTWVSMGEKLGTLLTEGIISAVQASQSKGGGGNGDWTRALAETIWGAFGTIAGILGMGPAWQTGNSLMGAAVTGMSDGRSTPLGGGGGGISLGNLNTLFGNNKTSGEQPWTNYGASSPDDWENPYAGGGDYSAPPMVSSHAGSWMRYHRGGWPGLYDDETPAILQRGERVLSRAEVSRMGGAPGVDRAASGGGSVSIYAFDAQSMLETFAAGDPNRAGRAIFDAVRLGRGPLRSMFGAR